MQRRNAPRRYRIEVLMRDRISPVDQLLKQFASALVPGVQGVHFRPEIDSQAIEIRTDGAGVRIASAEASVPGPLRPQHCLQRSRDDGNHVIEALGMKIAAESLKVRRQECGIGIIDLLRGIPPASLGPTNHRMRVFDLVEGIGPFSVPPDQGVGWHWFIASVSRA
jgi:hypothetical protein